MKSGIYKIVNNVSNEMYIGSSVNIKQRWNLHRRSLRNNKHHSKYLQRSYNKHGVDNFSFEVILHCPVEELIQLEQYYIDFYQPNYNSCKTAGSTLGYKASEETKLKQSIALKGRKHSEESIERMKIAQGGKVLSEETKKKISLAHTGLSNPKLRKSIFQICPNTLVIINTYESIKSAEEICNVKNLDKALSNKRKTVGGFIWKYTTDPQYINTQQ